MQQLNLSNQFQLVSVIYKQNLLSTLSTKSPKKTFYVNRYVRSRKIYAASYKMWRHALWRSNASRNARLRIIDSWKILILHLPKNQLEILTKDCELKFSWINNAIAHNANHGNSCWIKRYKLNYISAWNLFSDEVNVYFVGTVKGLVFLHNFAIGGQRTIPINWIEVETKSGNNSATKVGKSYPHLAQVWSFIFISSLIKSIFTFLYTEISKYV